MGRLPLGLDTPLSRALGNPAMIHALVLSLLLAPSPLAQDPAPTAAEAAVPRAVETVLRLADGRVVRAKVRAVAGGYELEQRGGALFFPQDQVTSARDAAGLLRELAAFERPRSVGPAAAARFALDAGLLPEALVRLDRALREEPSDRAALALIAERGDELPLGFAGLADLRKCLVSGADPAEALRETLRQGARLGPAARELVARELGQRLGPEQLGPAARAELNEPEGARRAFGALVHARALPERNLGPLVRQSLLDPSEAARTFGAIALGQSDDERVWGSLERAFHSEHSTLSLRAAEALSFSERPEVLYILVPAMQAGAGSGYRPPRSSIFVGNQRAYVQDFDVEVAQNASVADPVINTLIEGVSLDVAVVSVTITPATRLGVLRRAVERLSGEDPGSSHSARERWWMDYQSRQKSPTTAL